MVRGMEEWTGVTEEQATEIIKKAEAKKAAERAAQAKKQYDQRSWIMKLLNIDFNTDGIVGAVLTGDEIKVANRLKINLTPMGKTVLFGGVAALAVGLIALKKKG